MTDWTDVPVVALVLVVPVLASLVPVVALMLVAALVLVVALVLLAVLVLAIPIAMASVHCTSAGAVITDELHEPHELTRVQHVKVAHTMQAYGVYT